MLSKVFLSTLLAAALILTLFDDNETFAIEYYKPPSQITGVTETIVSPDGHFELFYRREEVRGIFNQMYSDHQIWIRSKTEQEKPVLLYSYGRDANVSWSPDSTMVALTDFEGSSNSHVVIFRISPQLVIEPLPEIDSFVESHSKTMLPSYDHFYAEVVGWAVDGRSLAIELRGDLTEWDLTQTEYTTRRVEKQVIFRIPEIK